MFLLNHVDKIDDDDAAQIPQAQFARNRVAGFQIGFEDGFVKTARAHKTAGVHIDGRHGLGGFDNQIAAEVQVHARLQGTADFGLDAVGFKQGAFARETVQLRRGILHVLLGKRHHFVEIKPRIDQDFARVVVEQISQDAFGQWQILIQQGFGRTDFGLRDNIAPHAREVVDIGLQFGIGGGFRAGADNVAVAGLFGQERVQPFAQTVAFFFVFNAL